METTEFPFLNQEFDYSHLLNLFHDMDSFGGVAGGGGDGNPGAFKRLKTNKQEFEEEKECGGDGSALRELLASFVLIEEDAREENQRWASEFHEEKSLRESNHRKRAQSMSDYYYQSQLDSHCIEQLSELSESRSRSRRSASLAAASAAVTEVPMRETERESSGNPPRRLWVKDRSKDWWDMVNSPGFPDAEFKRAFRMSRATFDMICGELDLVITKKNTTLRDAIPVSQRVAVCIWRLATGEPLRLVSKKFGLGISTCHKLVLEVSTAIRDILLPKFVQWPGDERLASIKTEFEAVSGIPNIGGSMYTTHIPIIAPKVNVSAYYNKRHTERNQKTSYSVTVQGIVDCRGVFTDISIGWPGSMSDDQVLEKSTLFKKASSGLLRDTLIAGNSGYPLTDWVLVPYSHTNQTWAQHAFNEKLQEVLSVGKEAFCRLKGRWSCLQKRTEVKLQDLPVILGACCVLHNVCEMRGEEVGPELRFEVFDDEVFPIDCIRGSPAAARAREHIAHNLFHHGRATAFL